MKKKLPNKQNSQSKKTEFDDMLERLSSKQLKKDIKAAAKSVGEEGDIFLKLSLHPVIEIAARASWAYRDWASIYPEKSRKLSPKMVQTLHKTTNGSVIRNLLGAVLDQGFPRSAASRLLEVCMDHFTRNGYAIAVYANILGVFAEIVKIHPEIKHEVLLLAERHPMNDQSGFIVRLRAVASA
jgi:hypothetical protein